MVSKRYRQYNIADAKARLSSVVRETLAGADVVIAKDNKPLVRVLLDTYAFLWWVSDDARLSARARTAVRDASEAYVSIASCWEMAIKVGLDKLTLAVSVERFISEHVAANHFSLLPIDVEDVGRVARLPFHHRDPFDRLLAAQALGDGLAIVSADLVFRKYGVTRVW
jgi:PIN domain nuclease of toxin-antitoxin system